MVCRLRACIRTAMDSSGVPFIMLPMKEDTEWQSKCRTIRISKLLFNVVVFREEIVPIGNGPQFNPDGKADVSTSLTGRYTITTDDLKRALPNRTQTEV